MQVMSSILEICGSKSRRAKSVWLLPSDRTRVCRVSWVRLISRDFCVLDYSYSSGRPRATRVCGEPPNLAEDVVPPAIRRRRNGSPTQVEGWRGPGCGGTISSRRAPHKPPRRCLWGMLAWDPCPAEQAKRATDAFVRDSVGAFIARGCMSWKGEFLEDLARRLCGHNLPICPTCTKYGGR